MSFTNPVNEPVQRFSSTDTGAPQINYNARTAGDVKAVLKACLVTGYGAIAGAGWSIVNEVDHVCEFVSPSAAMSDYRLGIDDTSASSTTWYYTANGVQQTVGTGAVSKSIAAIAATDARNHWELLVTARGLIFIENVVIKSINELGSSVTYWGQIKSDIDAQTGKNIAWWSIGYNSPVPNQGSPTDFFSAATGVGKKYVLNDLSIDKHAHPALPILSTSSDRLSVSNIEFASEWFLIASNNVVAQQPAVLVQVKKSSTSIPVIGAMTAYNRPVLNVWPVRGASSSTTAFVYNYSHAIFKIYLDYWEY